MRESKTKPPALCDSMDEAEVFMERTVRKAYVRQVKKVGKLHCTTGQKEHLHSSMKPGVPQMKWHKFSNQLGYNQHTIRQKHVSTQTGDVLHNCS